MHGLPRGRREMSLLTRGVWGVAIGGLPGKGAAAEYLRQRRAPGLEEGV